MQKLQTFVEVPLELEVRTALATIGRYSWPKLVMTFNPALRLGDTKLSLNNELVQMLPPVTI
jgi:hypothetical protein